jgi:hypothetical protein
MKKYNYKLFLSNGELEKEIKTNNLNYIMRYRKKEFCDDSGSLYSKYFNSKETINDNPIYYYL